MPQNLLTTLLLLFVFQTPAAQQNTQATATLEGVVIRLGSAQPLPGTRVGLVKVDGSPTPYSMMAGSDGKFRFTNLEAGSYRVLAVRDDGFLPAEYGQRKPGVRGTPLTLGVGDAKTDVQLAMSAPAAVSGSIFDRDGDPIMNAQVQALKAIYRDGKRALTIIQSVSTNDLGEYRLYWLAPGSYYISAKAEDLSARRTVQTFIRRPEDQMLHDESAAPFVSRRVLDSGEVVEEVQMPTYFPGTTDLENAREFSVRAGEDVRGIDINIKAMPPNRHVRGTVVDAATGQPIANAPIRAILQNSTPNVMIPNATSNATGAFELTGLIPGSYYLFANPAAGSGFSGGRGGRIAIDVAAKDVENVTIIVPPGFTIPGRFILEGTGSLDLTGLRISIRRDPDIVGMPFPTPPVQNGTASPSNPTADGTFTLAGIGAGDYRFSISYFAFRPTGVALMPPNVYVKSARLGMVDLLTDVFHLDKQPDGLLEVVLATNPGAISGTVTDGREPIGNTMVVLIPDGPSRSRNDLHRRAGTDTSGRFNFRDVAPGDYKLFAWDDVENGAWFDSRFMQAMEARGTPVHVREQSTENSQLTIIKSGR